MTALMMIFSPVLILMKILHKETTKQFFTTAICSRMKYYDWRKRWELQN